MIRLIIYIAIGILILSFFEISLRSIIESPTGQENISYVWNLIVLAALWIWELIATGAIWVWDLIRESGESLVFWD